MGKHNKRYKRLRLTSIASYALVFLIRFDSHREVSSNRVEGDNLLLFFCLPNGLPHVLSSADGNSFFHRFRLIRCCLEGVLFYQYRYEAIMIVRLLVCLIDQAVELRIVIIFK